MGSLDFSGISDDAGALLVAGLKDSTTTATTTEELAPVRGMSTRRSAARTIPRRGSVLRGQVVRRALQQRLRACPIHLPFAIRLKINTLENVLERG